MTPNKKISVVGNAASLFQRKQLGTQIDSSYMVIRFNGGTIKNHNAQGWRTTIQAHSHRMKSKWEIPKATLWDVREMEEREYLELELGVRPSCGIIVLEYLKNKYPDHHVKIFGFDWKATHSWYCPDNYGLREVHNYGIEKKYCMKLIEQQEWSLHR